MTNAESVQIHSFSLEVPFHSRIGEERFSVDVLESTPQAPSRGCILIVDQDRERANTAAQEIAAAGITAWVLSFVDTPGWDKPLATLVAAAALWTKSNAMPLAVIGTAWGASVAELTAARLKGSGIKAVIAIDGPKTDDLGGESAQLPLVALNGDHSLQRALTVLKEHGF